MNFHEHSPKPIIFWSGYGHTAHNAQPTISNAQPTTGEGTNAPSVKIGQHISNPAPANASFLIFVPPGRQGQLNMQFKTERPRGC